MSEIEWVYRSSQTRGMTTTGDMMSEIEWYEHHGAMVAVQSQLKGKHREHCLCYQCGRFTPENRQSSCKLANLLYAVCVACELTTPVFECARFVAKAEQ